MLVGEFIGLVMLAVNGGKPTTDSSVLPHDIRAYLPAANNQVLDATHDKNEAMGLGDTLPTSMYSFYKLPINSDTRPYSVYLPVDIIELKSDYGIGSVVDDAGNLYAPIPNAGLGNLNYFTNTAPGIKWHRRKGKTIQIYTDNPLISEIEVQCLVAMSELKDEDILPVQAGMEKPILDTLVTWFGMGKAVPADTRNDSRDINATP